MRLTLENSHTGWGVAQSGLARLLGVQEVTGSNPVAPTTYLYPCRLRAWRHGHRFKSGRPDHSPSDSFLIRISFV